MTGAAFSLFDTPIGAVAIVWRGERVIRLLLPEPRLREKLLGLYPDATEAEPSGAVADLAGEILKLLAGGKADFAEAPLDFDGVPDFERQVYAAAADIPAGETRTYGELAQAIGQPGAARAVGAALGRNPFPIVIPCHRILSASGSGGFSAPGGAATKIKLLGIEQARRSGDAGLFDYLPLALAPARSGAAPSTSD